MDERFRQKEFFDRYYRSAPLAALQLAECDNVAHKARIIAAQCPDSVDKRVLEIGCGTGKLTGRLTARILVALDVCYAPLAYVRSGMSQVLPVQASAERIGLRDESIDIVIGNGILHHAELTLLARETERLLVPGGSFVFFEPNAESMEICAAHLLQRIQRRRRTGQGERHVSRQQILAAFEGRRWQQVLVQRLFSRSPNLPAFLVPVYYLTNIIFSVLRCRSASRELLVCGWKS